MMREQVTGLARAEEWKSRMLERRPAAAEGGRRRRRRRRRQEWAKSCEPRSRGSWADDKHNRIVVLKRR